MSYGFSYSRRRPSTWFERYSRRMKPWQKRSRRMSAARRKGKHTDAEWARLLALCGHRCVCCGTTNRNLERDHIVPVSRGGSDAISNLQPLCATCNNRKGTATCDHRPALIIAALLKA